MEHVEQETKVEQETQEKKVNKRIANQNPIFLAKKPLFRHEKKRFIRIITSRHLEKMSPKLGNICVNDSSAMKAIIIDKWHQRAEHDYVNKDGDVIVYAGQKFKYCKIAQEVAPVIRVIRASEREVTKKNA